MGTYFDLLNENDRTSFLRFLMQSFQCSYVCFWSYVPRPTNCLKCQDGMYCEEFNIHLPSSSSGSLAQRLFNDYTKSTFTIHAENEHIPGFAFRNCVPFYEIQELELARLASKDTQRHFYQKARIKTTILMGFKTGEIEIGFSNVPTITTKKEIQSLFFPDFQTSTTQPQQQQQLAHEQLNNTILIPTTDHQNPHYSSSSSSLRSLSNIDSPEYSSLHFTNINNNNNNATSISTSQVNNSIPSLQLQNPIIIPHHQQEAMQAFARLRNPQFPNPVTEEQTITQTILAVLTSKLPLPPLFPSSSSSASSSLTYSNQALINTKSSAFESYKLAPLPTSLDHNLRGNKSLFKRTIRFFQSLNLMRNNRNQTLQIPRPNVTQMHHMMSERKRREKLNECFHALRSLLPPGTKKDKASLLNTTKEYLNSLKAQIEELTRRNKQLEAQLVFPSSLLTKKEANHGEPLILESSSDSPPSDQRAIDISLRHVTESASEDRQSEDTLFDLQVIARAAIPIDDLVLRVLAFMKRLENIRLMSMEASSDNLAESRTPINRLNLRLRVDKGSDFDESSFQEAVRRVVADMAK